MDGRKRAQEPRKQTKKPRAPNDSEAESQEKSSHVDYDLMKELAQGEVSRANLGNNPRLVEACSLFFTSNYARVLSLDCRDAYMLEPLISIVQSVQDRAVTLLDAATQACPVQAVRRAIRVHLTQSVNTAEGEVTELRITRNSQNDIEDIQVSLRTARETARLRLEKSMAAGVENINVGDVIYVEPTSGFIKRLGRSENCVNEHDLEGDKYLPVVKGPVMSVRTHFTSLGMDDVDYGLSGGCAASSAFTRLAADAYVRDFCERDIASRANSCLIVQNIEECAYEFLHALLKCAEEAPELKLVLIGDVSKMPPNCAAMLRCVIRVQPEPAADMLAYLRKNYAEFTAAAREKADAVSFAVLSELLAVAKDKEEFAGLLDAYHGMR